MLIQSKLSIWKISSYSFDSKFKVSWYQIKFNRIFLVKNYLYFILIIRVNSRCNVGYRKSIEMLSRAIRKCFQEIWEKILYIKVILQYRKKNRTAIIQFVVDAEIDSIWYTAFRKDISSDLNFCRMYQSIFVVRKVYRKYNHIL